MSIGAIHGTRGAMDISIAMTRHRRNNLWHERRRDRCIRRIQALLVMVFCLVYNIVSI